MSFVIDASVVLDWALHEHDDVADRARLMLRADNAFAPALWWFEVRSGLIVNERRGRLSQSGSAEFLQLLSQFPIELDRAPDEAAMLALARRHWLTVYDAAYLELALRERVGLATLDEALAAAARREAVAVIGDAP